VKIHCNCPINRIQVENNQAKGVILDNGIVEKGDIIVVNADLPYAYRELLPQNKKIKKFDTMLFTNSALIFHWGMDRVFPQFEHHSIFLPENYRNTIKRIFENKDLPEDPIIYLCRPTRTDSTAAPEGNDTISAVIPTGHIDNNQSPNWKMIREKGRLALIHRLKKYQINNFEKSIKFEFCYSPETWANTFNLTYGALFGSLGHNLSQIGYLRPQNRHEVFKNIFFVGGCTHPGSGIPMVFFSAKQVSERIINGN
jgi:phytoene desaturase